MTQLRYNENTDRVFTYSIKFMDRLFTLSTHVKYTPEVHDPAFISHERKKDVSTNQGNFTRSCAFINLCGKRLTE